MDILHTSNSFWILPVELEMHMFLIETPCHFVMLFKFGSIVVAKDDQLVLILSTWNSETNPLN